MDVRRSAITITYGDCAENHVGMQKLGVLRPEGLTYSDLATARDRFERLGCRCELVDLVSRARAEDVFEGLDPEPAEVLVVRGAVDAILGEGGADALYTEQNGLPHDKKALMKGRVVNKLARHNLCFADRAQEPDYEAGRGRVVSYGEVPLTAAVRNALPPIFGEKTAALYSEGNYYYDPAKCGIGFHGDSERRIVVAVRVGADIPLHFQWFYDRIPRGGRVELELRHGDMYAMSQKAVGTDWKRPSLPTLRHAAGAQRFLVIAGQ